MHGCPGPQPTPTPTPSASPPPPPPPPSPAAPAPSGGEDSGTSGWAPFNGPRGKSLLGQCDLAFLGSYAFGLFFLGHLGDTMDLRWFLSVGMVGTGVFTCLYGMGYFWRVHDFWYFVGVQVCAGLFQSTGWPSVVAVMGRWFGKGKRGLIMGIWNAHTSGTCCRMGGGAFHPLHIATRAMPCCSGQHCREHGSCCGAQQGLGLVLHHPWR